MKILKFQDVNSNTLKFRGKVCNLAKKKKKKEEKKKKQEYIIFFWRKKGLILYIYQKGNMQNENKLIMQTLTHALI